MKRNNKIIGGGLIGTGASLLYVYKTLRNNIGVVPSDSAVISPWQKQYVYPVDPEHQFFYIKSHLFKSGWHLGYLTESLALQMFRKIRREDGSFDQNKLKDFVKLSWLLEGECHEVANNLDTEMAIVLARAGADPRVFTAPTIVFKQNREYYGTKFREIFDGLPKQGLHEKLTNAISYVFSTYHPTESENEDRTMERYSGFESDFHLAHQPLPPIDEVEFLRICLMGLLSHSRHTERVKELLKLGTLDLLTVIGREYGNHQDLMSLVLKVLANISCDPTESTKSIKDSGCLKLLAEASQHYNLRFLLPAKRALHNLDRRFSSPIMTPGVYQLYPEHGCDETSYDHDVVFIHGLLGGVCRTWRRNDYNPSKPPTSRVKTEQEAQTTWWKTHFARLRSKNPFGQSNPPPSVTNPDSAVKCHCRRKTADGTYETVYEDVPLEVDDDALSTPTGCWPRDWLSYDLKNGRHIAVDFETYVTEWMNICPVETTERRLKDRAAEILKKLHSIGLGKRPVVFITHSMGGILLKSVLCQAENHPDPAVRKICENTKGVVFCSVPHLGAEITALTTARKWLLLPTEEIQEMSNQDHQLTRLNDGFLKLCERFNYNVLSFGEILETKTGWGMLFKLVPFQSADIGIGEFFPLRLDHLGTCKPWSRGSFLYIKIVEFIKEACALTNSQPTLLPQPEITLSTTTHTPTPALFPSFEMYIKAPLFNIMSVISNLVFSSGTKNKVDDETPPKDEDSSSRSARDG